MVNRIDATNAFKLLFTKATLYFRTEANDLIKMWAEEGEKEDEEEVIEEQELEEDLNLDQ